MTDATPEQLELFSAALERGRRRLTELGLEFVAPYEVAHPEGTKSFALVLFPPYGKQPAVIVEPGFEPTFPTDARLMAHAQAIHAHYSIVSISGRFEEFLEIDDSLADWGRYVKA